MEKFGKEKMHQQTQADLQLSRQAHEVIYPLTKEMIRDEVDAEEYALVLAEIYPDMKRFVEGMESNTLTIDVINGILIHVGNHLTILSGLDRSSTKSDS